MAVQHGTLSKDDHQARLVKVASARVLPEAGRVWSWQPYGPLPEARRTHGCPTAPSAVAHSPCAAPHCSLSPALSPGPCSSPHPCWLPKKSLAVPFWGVALLVSTCGRVQGWPSWDYGECEEELGLSGAWMGVLGAWAKGGPGNEPGSPQEY